MVIFNNTSADFVLISAVVLLKITTILKELREQLQSKNKRTLIEKLNSNLKSTIFFWFSQWYNHDFFAKNGCAANNQISPSERRPPQSSAHMSLGNLGNLHRGLSKNFANYILVYYFKASKNCKNGWPQFCSAKKGQF